MTRKFTNLIVGFTVLTSAFASQQLNDEVQPNTPSKTVTGPMRQFDSLQAYQAYVTEFGRTESMYMGLDGIITVNPVFGAPQTHEFTRSTPNGTETVKETFRMINGKKVVMSSSTARSTSTSAASHSSTSSKSSKFGFGF